MPYKDPAKRAECKRNWSKANPDKQRDAIKRWTIANKERKLEIDRRWRNSHPEQVAAKNKAWQLANRGKVYEYKRERRAQQYNAINSVTPEQAAEIFKAGCMFCGSHENLTIAHDTPVSRGGNTTRGNTFCLCQRCNSKMHTKSLKDMLKQLFFL